VIWAVICDVRRMMLLGAVRRLRDFQRDFPSDFGRMVVECRRRIQRWRRCGSRRQGRHDRRSPHGHGVAQQATKDQQQDQDNGQGAAHRHG
jgi:hypothetical protein